MQITELNGTNCRTYLVVAGTQALLVDPVRERLATYRQALVERGLALAAVVETHTHADHLMLRRDDLRTLGAPLVMHHESPLPFVDRHVSDGDTLGVGNEEVRILHTPGHTPDSICLHVPGAVLTGDTLLIGGSGRTDFPGGDAGAQWDAVTTRLFALPDDTVVWPAHDYHDRTSSTIGDERRTNPRFAGRTREQYVALMAGLGLPFPDRIQDALQVNQSGFEASEVDFPAVTDIAAIPQVGADALARKLAGPDAPIVIDVREPEEFVSDLGHVAGALPVPMDALQHRLPKLLGYADRDVVLVCRAGARSASAAAILHRAGFTRVTNLTGGMLAWVRAGLPVQR